MTKRRNLLFVLTDEQKASALGLYGNPVVSTPALERIADEGTICSNAFVTCPLCVPSRASIFSGRYPRDHGLWTNKPRLSPSVPHLFEMLRDAGYHLGLVGKNHWLPDDALPLFFDTVVEAEHTGLLQSTTPESRAVNEWLARREFLYRPWSVEANPFRPEHCPPTLLADAALEFLARARERPEPFCLWLSIPDPHTPIQAPSSYLERLPIDEIPLPVVDRDGFNTKPLRQHIARHMFASEDVPEPLVRESVSMYYALEEFIDEQMGRVLTYLDASGLSDETLVVFTSDHGTYLGEHGMPRKAMAFYDCLIQVPLVLRWPGHVAAGTRVEDPVSLVELLPTVLDLLGQPRPADLEARANLLAEQDQRDVSAVFAEAGVPGSAPPVWSDLRDVPAHPLDGRFFPWGGRPEAWFGPAKMVRSETAKLVRYDTGEMEVYDLISDPGELVNLADSPLGRELAAELDVLLQRF